jgi:hypothetical protein
VPAKRVSRREEAVLAICKCLMIDGAHSAYCVSCDEISATRENSFYEQLRLLAPRIQALRLRPA